MDSDSDTLMNFIVLIICFSFFIKDKVGMCLINVCVENIHGNILQDICHI